LIGFNGLGKKKEGKRIEWSVSDWEDDYIMFPHEDEHHRAAGPSRRQRPSSAPPVKAIIQHHHHRGGRSLLDLERTTTASTASSEDDDDDDDDSSFGGGWADGDGHHHENLQQQHHQPQQQQQLQQQWQQYQNQQQQLHEQNDLQQQLLVKQQKQHLISQQLINAAIQCKTEKVRRLLVEDTQRVNVDINTADERYGATALHYACIGGSDNVELVQLLLEHGANVHAQQRKGRSNEDTALHHASAKNHVNVARLLLQHGASITVQNKAGQTPVDVAATDAMATTLRDYRCPGSDLIQLPPPERVQVFTGKYIKEQQQLPLQQQQQQQQHKTTVAPEQVEVVQKRSLLFLDTQPTEKKQQRQQQEQHDNANYKIKRLPDTLKTKRLQEQHHADMSALHDIVKTLLFAINQCKHEQHQHASAKNPVMGSSSHVASSPRSIAELDDNHDGNTSMLLSSLQAENAALRQTVTMLQVENATLYERLEVHKQQSQSPQQQEPKTVGADYCSSSVTKNEKNPSAIFRENPAIASASTAENVNINNSSSTVGERMEAMQDTIECYKMEMACLQEQLRASQRQQQSHHHHHQQRQRHVPQSPLRRPVDLRGFSASLSNSRRHDNDRQVTTTTTTTEQELQNIMTDLLALTRRYMEERDNNYCQNSNMI
jgi:Ankyrin repeats (3 copies)